MGLLTPIDALVLISYLIGITLIGARFYRRKTDTQAYFLGDKNMKWLPVALSILAADTSAISYLGLPAWSFQENLRLNQSVFTYFLAIPLVIWIFVPTYSAGNLYTAYQFLERRFDLRVRLMTSVLFLLLRGAHVAVVIYAPALMMSQLVGVPLAFPVLAMGLLTTFYTTTGGIKSVIWTDAIQVATVMIGFGVLTVSLLSNIPGGVREVIRIGAAHQKWSLFDFSFTLNKVDNFWALLIGGTLLAMETMGTDQAVLQKYFTTRSERETRKSLLFYGVVIVPFITFLSVLGVILFVFYTGRPDLKASLGNPEAVVPHYAATMLPHGLTGLVLAGIFAGSMSTVSASLNSLATSSVMDVYKRLVRVDLSPEQYAVAGRWATALWGGAGTVGAFFGNRLGPLILSFSKVWSLLGGVILAIFLLGILTKRTTSVGVIVGSIFGLSTVVYVASCTRVTLYWYCVFGLVSTWTGGWVCSRMFSKR